MKRREDKTTFMVTQSQASLRDQLTELIDLANQKGLYGAADWLKIKIMHKEKIR